MYKKLLFYNKGPSFSDTYKIAKINFITPWAVDIIRTAYYIHGPLLSLSVLSDVFGAVDKTSSSFSAHGKIGNFIIIIIIGP